MCGYGAALKAVLPRHVYMGEKFYPSPKHEYVRGNFRERHSFNPLDKERVNFFAAELEQGERTLILFPQKETAKSFYEHLPDTMKQEALLWPSDNSPKLWQAWKSVNAGKFRIVIAPPGGIFAPLMPRKIIIEDEASPAYILPYTLNVSARSLAGHRAAFLGADFITAGRIPSLKTYARTKPKETLKPERRNIILSDIHISRKEEVEGITGHVPLTFSLIKHTYREIAQGNNVIWILGRTGEASEVFCPNCGEAVKCPNCGGIMQARNDGNILKCRKCGTLRDLPPKCENCGYTLLVGKRAGIEAVAKIAGKYCNDVHIFTEGSKVRDMHGLILSTQRGLALCGKIKVGLVAWLDLDDELWGQNHNVRYNVYSMLCESYWRGRENDPTRKVLIQARRSGMKLAGFLAQGWTKFIREELRERKEFMLPPYGYIIELELGSKILREEIINLFMDAGIFVMDPGDNSLPLYVNAVSLEPIRKMLESYTALRNTIKITVRSE